jgi:hypothetical protein
MEKRDDVGEVPMKKIISVLVLLLISATTLSNYATSKIYLPIALKSKATPTPYVTLTPTPYLTATPTSTPTPGATPVIEGFFCMRAGYDLSCFGSIKNVGDRPISDVMIEIDWNNVFKEWVNSGTQLIQPGATKPFNTADPCYGDTPVVSASVYLWIEH